MTTKCCEAVEGNKVAVRTVRCAEGARLAYYRARPNPAYWEAFWRYRLNRSLYAASERGNLGWIQDLFPRYVAPGGRVLDAGCGPGSYVLAMLRRGYHAEGIEWSDAVVSAVHAFHPDLPIRQGDATRLDLPSNTYDAYVSLGVMEHRRDGPEPFLGEARRVLRPGGVAFISVPYCHALRRARIRLGLYHRRPPTDLDFYQYAFGREEFAAYLVSAGFAVLAQVSYGVVTGLREEIRLLDWLLRLPRMGSRIESTLQRWEWGEHHLGHAILFVCRKPQ